MVSKGYRIRKYSDFKKKNRRMPFETYEPEKKLELKTQDAIPFGVRMLNMFLILGGWISIFASSFIFGLKNLFSFKKKVDNINFTGRKYLQIELES
jgi:hypothetical protein